MNICGNYQVLSTIGTGGFSDVFLGKHLEKGDLVALKIIKDAQVVKSEVQKLLENEVEVMKNLDHHNIVKLLDANSQMESQNTSGSKSNVCCLVLELVKGGELFDFIKETGAFGESTARYFFHQLIDALNYLHSQGISHRDLKPENIMLTNEYELKIGDFGSVSEKRRNVTKLGSVNYMAPEIHYGEEYTGHTVDLFAAGIILFTMVSGYPPFHSATQVDPHYKMIMQNDFDTFWSYHIEKRNRSSNFYSEEFRDLLTMMLTVQPIERPSLAEIVQHTWFKGQVATYEMISHEFDERYRTLNGTQEINHDVEMYDDTFRGEGEGEEEEESKRQADKYIPEIKRITEFFTTTSVDILFKRLVIFASQNSSNFDIKENKYSVTMQFKIEDQEVSLNVNILEVDTEKNCVEVTKSEGDKYTFLEAYKTLKDFFLSKSSEESKQEEDEDDY